ncbi:hypothetical protein D1007_53433 [Hordeum vulgare]|nr:hypothetical protein D1007_53433 [Hordeum vulgare]
MATITLHGLWTSRSVLRSRGIARAIQPPETPLSAGATPLTEQQNYAALFIIRYHIHPDLKSEYLHEESPSTLFLALKTRYEQQKAVFLPEALHDCTHLRLQDFKSIGEYNHAVHKISSQLRFYEKEPTEGEKIEKTLSTMLPSDRILQQQYRARNYTVYSELIHMLLQAEKHDELLSKNGSQRLVGAQPLPEVHLNAVNRQKFNGTFRGKHSNPEHKHKRHGNRKFRNMGKGKGTAKPKFDKSKLCNKCGCYSHSTEKCSIPKHLVMLYCTSNLWDAKHLKGKGLKPTSTFIHMAKMKLVLHTMFLLDQATP